MIQRSGTASRGQICAVAPIGLEPVRIIVGINRPLEIIESVPTI